MRRDITQEVRMSETVEAAQPTVRKRFESIALPILLTLVASVSAFASSFLGTSLANVGNRQIQDNQVAEERRKVERDKRADVYLKLLDASTVYIEKMAPLVTECTTPPQRTDPDP